VQSLLRNVGGADIYVSDATGGGQSSGGLSGMGSFMSLLGIGDNQERIVIKGSDYEMMQVVAEDVRYQVEQQDYISECPCLLHTPSARGAARFRTVTADQLRHYPCQHNDRAVGDEHGVLLGHYF